MSAEPLTMYCSGCDEKITVPVAAAFPKQCPRCGGTTWVSMPPGAAELQQ